MIGIVGKDGEGFRLLLPREGSVVDGQLRVVPFPPRRIVARLGLFNALVTLAVMACRLDDRRGQASPTHDWVYLAALAALLVEAVFKLRFVMRRKAIRVELPLDLRPIPSWLWAEHVQFFAALVVATVASIERDHPRHGAPWEVLGWLGVAMILLPWFNGVLLRRRRQGG
jgi:uncharacterized membrane protein